MNLVEEILRKKTMNLFSDTWYIDVTKEVEFLKNKSLGYVYFISLKNSNFIKIGKSINLSSRIKQLQQSAGGELMLLVGFIYTENYNELEIKLHKKLNAKRKGGEWFELNIDDCSEILKENNGVFINKYFSKKSKIIDGECFDMSDTNGYVIDSWYDDFFKYCYEKIEKGVYYSKPDFGNEIKKIKFEYNVLSAKKINLMVKKWAEIANLKYIDRNTNGVRKFMVV